MFRFIGLALLLGIILAACAAPGSPTAAPQPKPVSQEEPNDVRPLPKLQCLTREFGTDTFIIKDIGSKGQTFTYTGRVGPGETTSTNIYKGEHLLGYNLGSKTAVYLAQSEIISQTELASNCSTTRWQRIILANDAEVKVTGTTN